MSTHGPIEERYRNQMRALATALDEILNGDGPKTLGFMLLMFEFGKEGRVNYISNAERSDAIAAMKEWIARAEGRHIEETGQPLPGEQ